MNLTEILSIQSVSYDQWRMFAYIIRQIKSIPDVSYHVTGGNIYITRGKSDTYPCIVAHMDTVHDIVEDLTPVEFDGNITGFNTITMEQTGIGGDDKVGIYIALQCLSKFDNIKVAFFRDEEVGCVGSYDAEMSFFSDCRFVLQCDRRGNSDFVTTASGVDLSSKAFQDDILPIISSYGYKFAHGAMTDVMALKENGIKCSVANMSCGYYNPHMPTEYVNVFDVEVCLEMCRTIISYCTDTYKHKYKPKYAMPVATSYKYPKQQTKSFFDWATPKSSAPLWTDDYPDVPTPKEEDNYCIECWAAEATKGAISDNLCDRCRSWYHGEYNGVTF